MNVSVSFFLLNLYVNELTVVAMKTWNFVNEPCGINLILLFVHLTVVLNSNDFDFLQSRGANSVDLEDDRRSSLLLRFDPLAGRATQTQQLTPTVEIVEATVGSEKSFRDIDPAVCDNSLKENNSDAQHSPKTPSHATNAAEMSVSLIHDSKNMDNETNSYVNNIK